MTLKAYEIGIFNADVRRLNEEGESHPEFEDSWADMHYIEVRARDDDNALAQIERRFPKRKGFVINDFVCLTEFE